MCDKYKENAEMLTTVIMNNVSGMKDVVTGLSYLQEGLSYDATTLHSLISVLSNDLHRRICDFERDLKEWGSIYFGEKKELVFDESKTEGFLNKAESWINGAQIEAVHDGCGGTACIEKAIAEYIANQEGYTLCEPNKEA